MPIWDPYTIILGNWAWADGAGAQSVLGPTWATLCTPMAVMHAASGLGELRLGELGLGEMGGHLRQTATVRLSIIFERIKIDTHCQRRKSLAGTLVSGSRPYTVYADIRSGSLEKSRQRTVGLRVNARLEHLL